MPNSPIREIAADARHTGGCDMTRTNRRVAVSVTPLALEADSRTFRIACALAEAGFRTIVVEGRASRSRFWDGRIEVRSLAAPRAQTAAAPSRRGGGLRTGRLGPAGEVALYAAYRGHDWWRHCIRPLAAIPPADLYYLHSFEFYRAVAARAGGAPIIYDAHDFYRGIEPAERQPSFDRRYLRPFFNALEAKLFARAAAIVTVSDGVAGLIETACGRRPVVIRNCHDDRGDRAPTADLRAQIGLNPDERLCVVVGNCKPGMAIETAVAAIERLPAGYHLAFLGRGYERILTERAGGPLARRVHWGHVVAPNEVVPAIRSADLGLVLYSPYSENYRFALPNGFFQVVAAGLPVVRAPLPEIEAAIGGYAIGECLSRLDPDTLAGAISRCVEDAAALRAGTARLAATLRWENETRVLNRLIEAVLAERTAAPPDAATAAGAAIGRSA
jgi:glycosyltransferase involved in cell wall biosynthesis